MANPLGLLKCKKPYLCNTKVAYRRYIEYLMDLLSTEAKDVACLMPNLVAMETAAVA